MEKEKISNSELGALGINDLELMSLSAALPTDF